MGRQPSHRARYEGSLPFLSDPHPSGERGGVYDSLVSIAIIDAKEYHMSAVSANRLDFENPMLATRQDLASLRQELGHEVRLLKLDMDHRYAMLDLKIDSLHRELAHAAATQRQCLLALLGALVVFSFCVILVLMPV